MARWADRTRAFPYPFERAAFSLPDSRRARAGTIDLGRDAWRARGRRINSRRDLDVLERNPAARGRRRWPLVDSFGRRVAVLERHSNRFDIEDPFTGETLYRDRTLTVDQLEVQGRGCMVTEALERRFALIAFRADDRGRLASGETIVPFQLRAFIDRRALPRRNRKGQAIRGVVDDYSVGCGASDLDPKRARPLVDPAFSPDAYFVGEDGIRRTYSTYNAKLPYGGALYFLVNTTGVFGGGVVRGVARVGDPFYEVDQVAYCDPNVPDGRAPPARWSYGRIGRTRMWGWVVERC